MQLVCVAFFPPTFEMCERKDLRQETVSGLNVCWVKNMGSIFIFPSNTGPNETVTTKEATVYPQDTHLVTVCWVRL